MGAKLKANASHFSLTCGRHFFFLSASSPANFHSNDWPIALREIEKVIDSCLKRLRPLMSLIVSHGCLKADLHGTIFAYDCRMRFL